MIRGFRCFECGKEIGDGEIMFAAKSWEGGQIERWDACCLRCHGTFHCATTFDLDEGDDPRGHFPTIAAKVGPGGCTHKILSREEVREAKKENPHGAGDGFCDRWLD